MKKSCFLLLSVISLCCFMEADIPVPEFYGIYLFVDGKLVEIKNEAVQEKRIKFQESAEAMNIGRFGITNICDLEAKPDSYFLFYGPDFTHGVSNLVLFKLKYITDMSKKRFMGGNVQVHPNLWMADIPVQIRLGPVKGTNDLYRVVPAAPPEDGVYALSIAGFGQEGFLMVSAIGAVIDFHVGSKYQSSTTLTPKTSTKTSEVEAEVKESRRHYIDNGDGTVTDTDTNLMWLKADSRVATGRGMNWDDARAWVSGLRTGSHSDWRMPTMAELRSIYDLSFKVMAFDKDTSTPLRMGPLFANGGAYGLWSGEEAGSCCARLLYFNDGSVGAVRRSSFSGCGVRAVRSAGR